MTRYRLTAEGAYLYPGLDRQAAYEAAGDPDGIGGIFLRVHTGGKSPRYVQLRHFEEVPEEDQSG